MSSNKGANNAFRRQVLEELHKAGFLGAHRPIEHKGLALAERQRRDHGDILGLPEWAVGVRSSQTLDLSGAQHQVKAEAERGGCDLRAVVHKRKGQPVSDSYVVLPLHVWVTVLRRLHPEELLSSQVRAGASSPE